MSRDRPRIAFVGGVGRTGSTLIELAMGGLPDACPLGEVRHMWERAVLEDQRCGCGEPFSSCAFWIEVGERAFGGWSRLDIRHVLQLKADVDRTRQLPQLMGSRPTKAFRGKVAEYTNIYSRIYSAARDVSGRRVLIDSSKHISMAANLTRAQDCEVRVIHVVRNPVGVATSWAKLVRRPEVTGREEYMPRYGTVHASLQWATHNLLYEGFVRMTGVPRMVVRYEDFVAAPGKVLRQIADFIGTQPLAGRELDSEPPAFLAGTQHTIAGNPLRFKRGQVMIRADDSWQSAANAVTKATAYGLTYPTRRIYGYRASGRPGRTRPAQRGTRPAEKS